MLTLFTLTFAKRRIQCNMSPNYAIQINALSIIIKLYIERNLQLELIRYSQTNVELIHVCEATDSMQYRPANAYREVSNTYQFGSVSNSLGRLAASSQCMASGYKFLAAYHQKQLILPLKGYVRRFAVMYNMKRLPYHRDF